jgi:hypothetical protein
MKKEQNKEARITSCPPEVLALVERFDQNLESYRSGKYNETQLRQEFLNPLFEALGWDMTNRAGYAEAYKEVIHEDTIKIGQETKAPDYCFRIGGTRKFFLEAKKPSVYIKEEVPPAFQLRRYAWSAKLPLRVASHFGTSGRPDAWSCKESFVNIYLIVVAFIALLFPGIGLILRKIPVSLINLPNKDYWLSTERKEETIAVLSRQFLWFGSATLLLLLDIFHQSVRVHLGKTQTLEHPVASIVVYVVFTTFWSIALIVKFMRMP